MAASLTPELQQQTAPPLPDIRLYCFVCTGNTCRSPMAAAIFNRSFSRLGRAVSAGLAADGSPISANAKEILHEHGIFSFDGHVSRTITPQLMAAADEVIAISAAHAMQLIMRFPDCASKIRVMPRDISDPYGGDAARYRRCYEELLAGLEELFDRSPEAEP